MSFLLNVSQEKSLRVRLREGIIITIYKIIDYNLFDRLMLRVTIQVKGSAAGLG